MTVSPRDETEQWLDRKEIIIQGKEEYPLRVVFAPKSVVNCSAKLVIKTLRRKFSIPLLGYGGAAKIQLGSDGRNGRVGRDDLWEKERFLAKSGRGASSARSDFLADETKWIIPIPGDLTQSIVFVMNCTTRFDKSLVSC